MRSVLRLSVAAVLAAPLSLLAHGDVTPQDVDTGNLPGLGEDWLAQNPWRDPEGEHWGLAVEVGASGYNQNCARCHGLEAVSGGLAPDLRLLEADDYGDEWYLERFINGYTQSGITRMPGFGQLLSQEAAWAIRTYIETRPADGALNEFSDQLKGYRNRLREFVADGAATADHSDEITTMRAALTDIAAGVRTASGAARADSVASRALVALDGSGDSIKKAAEVLSVGLSAAQ